MAELEEQNLANFIARHCFVPHILFYITECYIILSKCFISHQIISIKNELLNDTNITSGVISFSPPRYFLFSYQKLPPSLSPVSCLLFLLCTSHPTFICSAAFNFLSSPTTGCLSLGKVCLSCLSCAVPAVRLGPDAWWGINKWGISFPILPLFPLFFLLVVLPTRHIHVLSCNNQL